MSEFKFACPVCGQHITADARASGARLECPTCFRKLIIPQAPASADSKLLITATLADKRKSSLTDTTSRPHRRPRSLGTPVATVLVGVLLVALVAGAAVLAFKKPLAEPPTNQPSDSTHSSASHPAAAAHSATPIPTTFRWTLNLTNVTIPESVPTGSIHGSGFQCDRVILQGGNLSFRQGKTWPPDLGLTILLFAQQPEDLSGKTVDVSPDRAPPLPRLILRWKDDQQQPAHEEFLSRYALKLTFGPVANGRIPGQIYVSLPDTNKSFLAGTFAAEIRKNPPPKPKPHAK